MTDVPTETRTVALQLPADVADWVENHRQEATELIVAIVREKIACETGGLENLVYPEEGDLVFPTAAQRRASASIDEDSLG